MTEEWSLRDEIFYTAHRWPTFMLFCLAGVLIGWLLALVNPTPYRATKELYVGLNIYQANQDSNTAQFSGVQFNNADDYKNWQMANLNSLVYIDPILDQTLVSLREVDPYWKSVSRHELSKMLHIYWRNAGKWRLVAEHHQSERARQAVLHWEAAVIERVSLSIEQSRQVMALHIQMQALANQQAEINSQLAVIDRLQQEVASSQAVLSGLSPNQTLSKDTRWDLWNRFSQAASGPEWLPVLETFPTETASTHSYQDWLSQAEQLALIQAANLQAKAEASQHSYNQSANEYSQASELSLGLSPNLHVEPITGELPQITQVRPLGLLLLIGASLGMIAWLFFNLVRINRKARR